MASGQRNGVPILVVLVLLLVALGGGALAGALGFIWITGGSGEASLTVEEALATREASEAGVARAVGTAMVEVANTVIAESVAEAVAAALDSSLSAAVDSGVAAAMSALAPTSELVEFEIIAAESQARFTLEEDLRGQRTTVIGMTKELGGSILVDMATPSKSTIGDIVINARTLATDNDMRNRALRSRILFSAQDENEFIVFDPQALSDFSRDSIAVGESITFNVTGDLTVTGVTRSVTFAAEATLVSEREISGRADLTLQYADFGLVIPEVPSVSWVADDVTLSLEFVARAQ